MCKMPWWPRLLIWSGDFHQNKTTSTNTKNCCIWIIFLTFPPFSVLLTIHTEQLLHLNYFSNFSPFQFCSQFSFFGLGPPAGTCATRTRNDDIHWRKLNIDKRLSHVSHLAGICATRTRNDNVNWLNQSWSQQSILYKFSQSQYYVQTMNKYQDKKDGVVCEGLVRCLSLCLQDLFYSVTEIQKLYY